jgi:hypothetical protein
MKVRTFCVQSLLSEPGFQAAGEAQRVEERGEAECHITCIYTLYGSESVEDLLNKEARPKRPAKRSGPRRNALPDSAQLVRAALFACVRRDFFQKADHHVRLADINAREVDRYKRDD